MSKVYLVTSGEYSDYCVRAVFSTEAAAEEYIGDVRTTNRYCDMQVEEYPLDAPREDLPGAYCVQINDAGEVVGKPQFIESLRASDRPLVHPVAMWRKERGFVGYGLTVEHARRSAEELRRQTLALEGKVVPS